MMMMMMMMTKIVLLLLFLGHGKGMMLFNESIVYTETRNNTL